MGTNYETVLLFSDYLEHFSVLVASSRKQTIIDKEQEEVKKRRPPFLADVGIGSCTTSFLSSVNLEETAP
jgi:hypothetical protein